MPDVLARGNELRQHEGPWADKASELEDTASGRPEEQVVIEEAGVDGIRQKEGVSFDVRSVHIDDRDAVLVEHARPGIGVVDLELGGAGDIAVDDELIGGRVGPTQEGVDGKGRLT
jgi:hypothetical protein